MYPDLGIYTFFSKFSSIASFCDFDLASYLTSHCSFTYYCTFGGDGLISWKSNKQTTVSLVSSCGLHNIPNWLNYVKWLYTLSPIWYSTNERSMLIWIVILFMKKSNWEWSRLQTFILSYISTNCVSVLKTARTKSFSIDY